MRLATSLVQDIRFQFRHGFYYVYGILSVMYILVLRFLPEPIVHPTMVLILFTDVCALGFVFIGATILLEKGQNITESLFVTPLRLYEYILSKLVSFLILSLLSTLVIILAARIHLENLGWFCFGLILSSLIYTLFGLIFAARARNVNDYFVRSLGLGMLISLPIVAYLGLFDSPIFYLFPSKATLILLDALGKNYPTGKLVYAGVSLLFWMFLFAFIAHRRFENHVRHPA